MSTILKKIKEDLKTAMSNEVDLRKQNIIEGLIYEKVQSQKQVSRSIISMYPEIGVKPDKATDDDTIKLLKKYISMEKTRELYIQKHLTEKDVNGLTSSQVNELYAKTIEKLGDSLTSEKIKIAQFYLPNVASEEDVIKWIKENIDFSKFKNKMQAMKPIMEQFKGMDGNIVKNILLKI